MITRLALSAIGRELTVLSRLALTDIRSQPSNQPHPFVCRFSSSLHRPANFSFCPSYVSQALLYFLFRAIRTSTFTGSNLPRGSNFGIVTRNNFLARPSTFYGLTSCPEQPGCHKNFVASLSGAWPRVDKTKFNATRCEEFRMTVVCAGRPPDHTPAYFAGLVQSEFV